MTGAHNKVLDRRVHDLDTIAAVLPIERRDELAELLTDQDVETLRHLVNEGMGANTLRALTSDLAYLQAWSLAATGRSLPWPAPEALLLKFVAHHLWDAQKRLADPDHGMPADVEEKLRIQGLLRSPGPHAPDTVRRRLATWSTLTKWRGLDGFFSSPASSPQSDWPCVRHPGQGSGKAQRPSPAIFCPDCSQPARRAACAMSETKRS